MRIGINASFLRKPNTGIGQVSANFLKRLAQVENSKGQASKLEFVLYLEEDCDFDLPDNFRKVVRLPFWKRDDLIRKIWWEKRLLPKMAKHDRCDVFLSLYQCPTVMPKKIKHLMLVHDIIPELFPSYLDNWRKKIYWSLSKKAIKRVARIMTVSKRTEKDLIERLHIKPGKISVNYIAADEIFDASYSEKKISAVLSKYELKRGYIYNGGGLEVRKNTELVLRAYKKLIKLNKKEAFISTLPQLVISGKLLPQLAPLVCDVEKLVSELNLKSKVKILGFVPQEDLPMLYAGAQLFVFPSFYEGFGIPVLESMLSGTPAITSKSSSLPEVGGDGVLYCDPYEVDDLAMVMKNVLTNQKLRKTMVERGSARAKRFSWEFFTNKTLALLLEISK